MNYRKVDKQASQKIFISLGIIVILFLAFGRVMDTLGEQYTDDSFKRALVTFAVARGINGVISVAQGTEVAIHPAGFGVNFTPGEILDPVNDLVERFSWIMLVSTTSLGLQKILHNISSFWFVNAILTVSLIIYLIAIWKPHLLRTNVNLWFRKLIFIVLFVRFAVPCIAVVNELIYQQFLVQQYEISTRELEKSKQSISDLNKEHSIDESSEIKLLDKAKRLISSVIDTVNISAHMDQYKTIATTVSEHTINLIVVFFAQTVLFPLLFVWLLLKWLKQYLFY